MSSRKAPVVLLIGPEPEGTGPLKARLCEGGVRVVEAASAGEAGELARRYPPDLVVVGSDLENLVSGMIAGLVSDPQPSLFMVASEAPRHLEALRRRLGPLFYAATPVEPARLAETVMSAVGRIASSRTPERPPPLLLCVDDDPLFLKGLARTLTRHGYRVAACGNAKEALETLLRVRPDMAILDVMMPGMDGLQLTETLRHREQGRIPVVLLSALATDEVHYEGRCRGATYTLAKPCESEKLLDVVDYLVGDLDDEERKALKERLP